MPTPWTSGRSHGASATKVIAFHVVAVAVVVAVLVIAATDMTGTKQSIPSPTREIPAALLTWQQDSVVPLPESDAKAIAIGAGKVFIPAGRNIHVYDLSGSYLVKWELDRPARGVAVGPDKKLFVLHKQSVQVLDARTGKGLGNWPSENPNADLLSIAVVNDHVFASDYDSRAVEVWDVQGNRLQAFQGRSAGQEGFYLPSRNFALAAGHDGLLRVVNPGMRRVEAYSVDGQRQFVWGEPGSDVDDFCGCCNPLALAVFPDGRVVTSEKALPTVKVFTNPQDGTLDSVVAGPDTFGEHVPRDVAVDARGRIWILVPDRDQALIYRPQTAQARAED